jgi:hypothetical protein
MTQINLILPTYLAFAIKNDDYDDLDAQERREFDAWWADLEKRHGSLWFYGCRDYIGDAEGDDYTGGRIWDHQLVTLGE